MPTNWRPRLNRIAMLGGALTLLVGVLLLGATAYRTGLAPLGDTFRSGTVHVASCQPAGLPLLAVQRCAATVTRWGPASADIPLTEATNVSVLSRRPLSGSVEVSSYADVSSPNGNRRHSGGPTVELIMPTDQRPLPDGVKLIIGLLALLGLPVLGTLGIGRIGWEVVRAVSRRGERG